MPDPYSILGLSPDSSDDTIRRRYLALIRTHSPDRDPDRFTEIREAYEKLRDPVARLRYQLFEAGKDESLDVLIADAKAQTSLRRVSVQTLRAFGRQRV